MCHIQAYQVEAHRAASPAATPSSGVGLHAAGDCGRQVQIDPIFNEQGPAPSSRPLCIAGAAMPARAASGPLGDGRLLALCAAGRLTRADAYRAAPRLWVQDDLRTHTGWWRPDRSATCSNGRTSRSTLLRAADRPRLLSPRGSERAAAGGVRRVRDRLPDAADRRGGHRPYRGEARTPHGAHHLDRRDPALVSRDLSDRPPFLVAAR